MIDPQPLSRDISQHELRSAYGRVTQDSTVLHDMFSGKADTGGMEASCILGHQRLAGGAAGGEEELSARLNDVRADIKRSKEALEQRKQSILESRSR